MQNDKEQVGTTADTLNSDFSPSSSIRNNISTQKALEKSVKRKLDFRILPLLWILYLLNFIDRANIGNAKIQGMETELELIDHRFNIVVWVFNLGYLVAGIPLMIVFRKYGPKTLCVMMFFWGITVIGCGFVRTWQQLVICRLLMGIAEAAFIAGAAYLIGAYYTAEEYLTRFVLFCTAGIIAGAINGFLSSWIALMDGARDMALGDGVMAWFIIVPWPEECTFLSQEEKECMLSRTREDGGHVNEDALTMSQTRSRVWRLLKDPKIWLGIAMNLGATENANSLANFQPTIIRGLGHHARTAQLLTIPVYVWGAVFSVGMAYLSARLRQRYLLCLSEVPTTRSTENIPSMVSAQRFRHNFSEDAGLNADCSFRVEISS